MLRIDIDHIGATRRLRRRIARVATGVSATAAIALAALPQVAHAQATRSPAWVSTWTASPEARWDGDFPLATGVPFSLWNQTIREVSRISIGGKRFRIVISNAYGTQPLVIGAAHVALVDSGAAIVPASDRAVTFGGAATITIPPGAPAISDPIDLTAPALGSLAVSLYLPEPSPVATFHWEGRQTAFIADGNHVGDQRLPTQATISARAYVTGILVSSATARGVVVGYGDSITDGAGSTPNANHRWTDFLASRLAPDDVAVINAGISGGRVLADRMGQSGLARFERDVLAQSGVRTVVLLMGINDISWPHSTFAPQEAPMHADELIAGYRQLIAQAHAHDVRVVGATLTPFEGALDGTSLRGYYSVAKDSLRQRVNQWIRTSGEFDAVVDFDALLRDPRRPSRFLPAYDSGDHLHPGDAGYEAMANALDRATLFGPR